jgi:hypothetical protein
VRKCGARALVMGNAARPAVSVVRDVGIEVSAGRDIEGKKATCETAKRARRAGAVQLGDGTSGGCRTAGGAQRTGVEASGTHRPGACTQDCLVSEGRGGICLERADAEGDARDGAMLRVRKKHGCGGSDARKG